MLHLKHCLSWCGCGCGSQAYVVIVVVLTANIVLVRIKQESEKKKKKLTIKDAASQAHCSSYTATVIEMVVMVVMACGC